MVFDGANHPLKLCDIPTPEPTASQVLIKILACGVCRTDLHILDGELDHPKTPLIMGHQIVGEVIRDSGPFKKGNRVGIPWLGKTCGKCGFCLSDRENLCDYPAFTGYSVDGGYAEFTVADRDFIFPLNKDADPVQVAPLLCAGMIGYRALRKAGNAQRLGFYGFGAAARLLLQVALYEKREVYAFTRPDDEKGQKEALNLGAKWAGSSLEMPPEKLDAALIFAPIGELVPLALKGLQKGGKVICGGIHMSDIPSFPYSLLWGERSIESVANLTRRDGEEFLKIAQDIPIKPQATVYPLNEANRALKDLKQGTISGTAVLIP